MNDEDDGVVSKTENDRTRCFGIDGNDRNTMMVAKSEATKWRILSDVLSCRADRWRQGSNGASQHGGRARQR